MTNEELEKELEITQKALGNTQREILKFVDTVYRTISILKAKGVIDDLDISYIKGELSADEYKKKYKEQNSLSNLYNQMFGMMIPTEEGSSNED